MEGNSGSESWHSGLRVEHVIKIDEKFANNFQSMCGRELFPPTEMMVMRFFIMAAVINLCIPCVAQRQLDSITRMSTYDKPIHFSYQESMESGASKGNGADKKESLAVFYDVYIVGEERLTSVTMANLGMMQMTLTRKGDRVTTVVVIDAAGRKDGYEAAKGAAATTAKFEPLLPVGLSPAFAPTVDSDRELSYSLNGDSRSYKFDERGKLTEVESTRGGRPEKRTVLTGWKASGAGDFGEYPTSIVYEQHKNDVLEVTRVDNIRVDNATADAIGALKNLVAGGDVQWRSDSTRQTRMAEAVRQAEKSAK